MKDKDKAAWRPRRFDVAGAHPDEAWRAVANIAEAVEDIRKSFIDAGYGRVFPAPIAEWQASKPMRFGNASDAQVQRFLTKGVEIMDSLPSLLMGPRQQEVRGRCAELAKSMEKVLARRPDDWRRGITRGRSR
jgi:hypothetical protein